MIQPLFFLVRHGKTRDNESNEYRGWSNKPEAQLTAEGRDDIREAGLFLKDTGYSFPAVLSDDLSRAEESRKILADVLGIKTQHEDKRLRTIDVGDFTGKSKADHPLTEYSKNPSKKIPGGESFNEFNKRMASVFETIIGVASGLKKPIIVVAHGAVLAFLYNHFNPGNEKAEYEGLVNPGGVLVFTKDGVIPLTKKREGGINQPYKDGTPVSGFVTDEENVPPRECWNCRNFIRDVNGLGACTHLLVRMDPKLISRRQADGTVSVGDSDCCDSYRNHISVR